MKRIIVICSLLSAPFIARDARAGVVYYQPNPTDLNDLDHHMVYTWRIGNINTSGHVITDAKISIKDIANWDANPNTLFIHLLDTAKTAGVASFVDDPSNETPVPSSQIIDDFADARYHNRSDWLVAAGTAYMFLTSQSFSTTPTNYLYTFTADQLRALNTYVANGRDVALGFDPDCHYFNDGLEFTITTAAVPEPSSLVVASTGVLILVGYAWRRRHAATST
jgi:hypothetical protein